MRLLLEAAPEVDGLAAMATTLIPLALMFAAMWFFLIRPESKRKKEAAKMRNELIVSDQVTTIGGISGKVVNIKDDIITIETGADKVRIHVMRWAVSSKGKQISE